MEYINSDVYTDCKDIYEGLDDSFYTQDDDSVRCAAKTPKNNTQKSDLGYMECSEEKSTTDKVPGDESSSEPHGMYLYDELLVAENVQRKKKKEQDKVQFHKLVEENSELKKLNESLQEKIQMLSTENANLKKNISSLYKTAKAEIEGRDILIAIKKEKMADLEAELKQVLTELFSKRNSHDQNQPSFHQSQRSKNPRYKVCNNFKEHSDTRLSKKNFESDMSLGSELHVAHGDRASPSTHKERGGENDKNKPAVSKKRNIFNVSPSKIKNIFQRRQVTKFMQERDICDSDQQKFNQSCESTATMVSEELVLKQRKASPDSREQNLRKLSKRSHQSTNSENCANVKKIKLSSSTSQTEKELPKIFKNDVLKLFQYRDEPVPFAVRRKLGLLKSKKAVMASTNEERNSS